MHVHGPDGKSGNSRCKTLVTWRTWANDHPTWTGSSTLTELGLTERLFDAVLNVYEVERDGRQDFRGETVDRYSGIDRGYAERVRDSALASGSSVEEANSQFEFYTENPPSVIVLADESERIRAIYIDVQFVGGLESAFIEVTIEELNATVDITAPAL